MAETELERLRRENDILRGLVANSGMDCIYCGLPAADMGKCKSGFPGCARADDIACAPDQEEKTMADPDYVYDPDNWETTYSWNSRDELTDGPDTDTDGTVYEFATLRKGPPAYAAWIVRTFTDDGDDDDGKWQWFRTREGANEAVKLARSKRPNQEEKTT